MSGTKKAIRKRILTEDILDCEEIPHQEVSPKPTKTIRRQSPENQDISQLNGEPYKKKKTEVTVEDGKTYCQRVVKTMNNISEARKHGENKMLKSLTEVLTQLEADYDTIKDNEQKIQHFTMSMTKCIQQISVAYKQNIKSLKEVQMGYKQEVEGLLTRGAMKPDDRPLWFDVYKAFPPILEPKFARPKPEIKPIRQILYQEDITRAKFHSNGHGLGVVNMLNPNSETQTKRLLEQYEKLKSEGVPEDELVQKSVSAVEAERQVESPRTSKPQASNAESVTSQVLAEADIKNIFKD